MTKTRVLFLGIDAADKDLIRAWTDAGHLPNFRRLFAQTTWGTHTTPLGLYVGAVWPSFYTGLSPAEHTRYSPRQLVPGTYEKKHFRPEQVQGEPFWSALSRAGKRVAVIDVPKTVPTHGLNGIHVVDWGTHDPEYDVVRAWPPELAGEILGRFGRDEVGLCDGFRHTSEEYQALRDALVRRVERKADIIEYYLEQGHWDCFIAVFSESHCIGHQCWHLHDRSHPRHDPELARTVGDPMLDVYIAIDGAIGRLLDSAGPEATVIVMASHGMGPHYDAGFLLDRMLFTLQRANQTQPDQMQSTTFRFAKSVWHALPGFLRQRAKPVGHRVHNRLRATRAKFSGRACFQAPNNDVWGGIRINLAGREPHGRIRPGTEYRQFCERLIRDLKDFINVETGAPLVRDVLFTADHYEGSNLHYLPDLLVEWNRDAPIASVYSPKTGRIDGVYSKCRTGDHRSEGIFFLVDGQYAGGALLQPVSIMDFGPTMAELLNVSLPRTEGQSILRQLQPV
jgi:predicted AlkP superfamily phosphohydrolase/phosphomutase